MRNLIIFIASFLLCSVQEINCQLSGYYAPGEVEALHSYAAKTLASSASLREIYYSVNILKMSEDKQISCRCDQVKSLLASSTTAYDIYYGVTVNNACSCGADLSGDLVNTARKSLEVN